MAASRASAGRLLSIIRTIQEAGPTAALRDLNLTALAGQPAENFFIAISEFVCPPGGALDESIARDAMFETIRDLADADLGNFDQLTPDQLNEIFVEFITRSIEGRVINDIGARGITLPADASACDSVAETLHTFIAGCTREAVLGRLNDATPLNDAELKTFISDIYGASFEVIATQAEREE